MAALAERVRTEAADAVDAEGEVDLAVAVELVELALVEQRLHHAVDLLGLENGDVLE